MFSEYGFDFGVALTNKVLEAKYGYIQVNFVNIFNSVDENGVKSN